MMEKAIKILWGLIPMFFIGCTSPRNTVAVTTGDHSNVNVNVVNRQIVQQSVQRPQPRVVAQAPRPSYYGQARQSASYGYGRGGYPQQPPYAYGGGYGGYGRSRGGGYCPPPRQQRGIRTYQATPNTSVGAVYYHY